MPRRHDHTQPLSAVTPGGQQRRSELVVAWLVGLVLAAIDVRRATAEHDTWLRVSDLVWFSLFAAATVTCLCVAWTWLRASLRHLCRARSHWLLPVAGLVDGAVIAGCVLATPMTSLGGPRVTYVAVGVPAGFALWSVLRERLPRGRVVVGVAGTVLCAWIVVRMPDRGRDWLRCGVDLSLLIAATEGFAALLSPRASVWAGHVGKTVVVAAALVAVAGQFVARTHEPLRRLIHERSLHTLALARPLEGALDPDGDGASWLHGGHDCAAFDDRVSPTASEIVGDGVDQNCSTGDGLSSTPRRSPIASAHGVATGADIVVLSIDALRWDLVNELVQTRAALGAHAQMTLATSPAPKTAQTFGALWRGRVLRGVEFEAPTYRTLPPNAPRTLAHVATAANYRAVMVPTHRYLAPDTRIGDGFEMSVPLSFEKVRDLSARDGGLVRANEAFAMLLHEAARDTSRPLLGWVHAMETHDPYFTDAGPGTGDATGQRLSVRDLDRKLAALIGDLKRVRDGRALVLAVIGDHGEEHGEHGAHFHATSVHAEQVRVGFLLSGPGIASRTIRAPVSIAQLAPTVAELVGLQLPDTFTETSLLACIVDGRGCPQVVASELESETLVGYTTASHRLIYDASHHIERLYDHARDPYEQHDLAAERPADLAEARALARAWNESH